MEPNMQISGKGSANVCIYLQISESANICRHKSQVDLKIFRCFQISADFFICGYLDI